MIEKNQLKILFVSAEVSPYAKTGGLADVANSLPQTLITMGHDVRVVMPRYKMIKSQMSYVTDFPVVMGCSEETCIIRETQMPFRANQESKNLPVYFVDSYKFYNRDGIYCYMDDAERFIFLCKAVLEMLPKIGFQPDIIHCNDWHTGPICMLLSEHYKQYPFYKKMATIFTIHNNEYQGIFPKEVIRFFNLGDSIFTPEKTEFYGMFNFMKAGLVYSDIINTVSSQYAKEIQTPEYGEKLEGLLKKRAKDLYGIVNGISYEEFNPLEDPRIYKNYDQNSVSAKKENKYAMQKEIGLPQKDVPVISLISRLTGQKGLNMVLDEFDEIMKNDIQFVLLGQGDPNYENGFKDLMKKYPNKVAVFIAFNVPLAQRIYAGSDIFLMPSRFEPCGLGQIISLRYGTIPVVRATGGLAETVFDYNTNKTTGNGFAFEKFNAKEMVKAISRAVKVYKNEPDEWKQLVERALGLDFSWNKPAQKYMEIYKLALNKKK